MPEYSSNGRTPRRDYDYDRQPRRSSYDEQRRPAQRTQQSSRPQQARPAGARPAAGQARPQQARPASQRPAGQRPQQGRPAGQRPVQQGSRRPVQRRKKKTVQPKFFIFAGIALVLIIALIVIFAGGKGKDNKAVQPQSTPAPVTQNGNGMDNVNIVSSQGDIQAMAAATQVPASSVDNPSTLAALLSDSNAQVAAVSTALDLDPSELDINPDLPDTWLNVLLLGTDERYLNQNARTDTMIICSINKTTGEVKLSNIMRDTAIDVRVGSKYDGLYRINAANYFGGPKYAIKTVNQCLDLNIEHYVMVNFFGFQKIAQALGGVTLDITEAEMNEINVRAVEQAWAGYYAGVNEDDLLEANVYLETYGPNTHLNGRQALAYARIRKLDSDASRAGRQQRVLQGLLDQLRTKNAAEIMIMGASLFTNVQTNMSLEHVLEIANVVLQSSDLEMDTLRLPVNGSYKQEVRNNDAMLYDTDWEHNTLELYNFIYG